MTGINSSELAETLQSGLNAATVGKKPYMDAAQESIANHEKAVYNG
jgi:hypothetical protein